MEGLSYNSGNAVENWNGKMMFVNQSVFMNRYNETSFADLPEDWKKHYRTSQTLDYLRLPLFNSEVVSAETYY